MPLLLLPLAKAHLRAHRLTKFPGSRIEPTTQAESFDSCSVYAYEIDGEKELTAEAISGKLGRYIKVEVG